jgi:MFS family permease
MTGWLVAGELFDDSAVSAAQSADDIDAASWPPWELAYAGGLILSSPVVGYLGERTRGRQLPLVIGLLFLIASLVMFMVSKTFALLLVSRILQGISGTVLFSLGLALLAECVPAERVAAASGNAMIGLSLGSVLGPVAGGALYDQLGYAAPWILCIALVSLVPLLYMLQVLTSLPLQVVVDLVLRLFIIEADRAVPWRSPDLSAGAISDVESEQKAEEAQAGTLVQPPSKKTPGPALAFAKLACHPRALASMLVSIAAGVLFGNLDAALTLRLHERYGLSATGAGLVFIAFAIPTVIFSPLSGYLSDRYGQKPAVLIGVLGVCPFFALLTIERMNLVAFVAVLTFVGELAILSSR